MADAPSDTTRYWRIRMTVAGDRDVSSHAWDMGQIGVWYGAWSAEEWIEAGAADRADRPRFLAELSHQKKLDWGPRLNLDTVTRFEAIEPNDWVLVYLRDRAQLGVAQLESGMHSEDDHPLNDPRPAFDTQEVFKYRRVSKAKVFSVPDLPDAYHLLASQGRSNVYQLHGMRAHVRLLAESADVVDVRSTMSSMPLHELVDFLGAIAWEALCTGYLSLEHGFIHTGLSTGGTLPTFDIVGRRLLDGMHIFAQCKKDPYPVAIQDSFKVALGAHTGPCLAFYFAYGNCIGDIPSGVEVFGKDRMLAWLATERGAKYRTLLLGG